MLQININITKKPFTLTVIQNIFSQTADVNHQFHPFQV